MIYGEKNINEVMSQSEREYHLVRGKREYVHRVHVPYAMYKWEHDGMQFFIPSIYEGNELLLRDIFKGKNIDTSAL